MHVNADQLNVDEKMVALNLVTVIGVASGDTSGMVSAGNAAKVENNHLSSIQALTFDETLSDCRKGVGGCQAVLISERKSVMSKVQP